MTSTPKPLAIGYPDRKQEVEIKDCKKEILGETDGDQELIDEELELEQLLINVGVSHPLVLWHQDNRYVFIKVMLPNVEKYHLRWSESYLYFR